MGYTNPFYIDIEKRGQEGYFLVVFFVLPFRGVSVLGRGGLSVGHTHKHTR